jgi:AcrR family transcriptional regulator
MKKAIDSEVAASADPERPYHHGNLVEALIAATVEMIDDGGVENVSVREVAKRAGVSPGAPFRHFRSKTALLTAVAEQAMDRLVQAVKDAQSALGDAADPIARFEAIGQGYLEWAIANPTHFQVISSRTLIDFHASETMRAHNDAIRVQMVHLLSLARAQGRIPAEVDFDSLVLSSRAFVYGLARMVIDGHFPEWHTSSPPAVAARQALSLFMGKMTSRHD